MYPKTVTFSSTQEGITEVYTKEGISQGRDGIWIEIREKYMKTL